MTAAFKCNKVVSIIELNECTRWFELENPISAQPGQFVMAWLPGIGEKPFSIASMDPCSLLVVDVGPFSHAMHQLEVGDPLWIKGPLGKGYLMQGDTLLLVGGGYGAAPLLPLASAAIAEGKIVQVCLGARTKDGILLSETFQDLGCRVDLATDDGSGGTKGLVTVVVEQAILESKFDTLYACGPTAMLSSLAELCKLHSLNYQLSWEAHMRCGMGLCGSCEVPVSFDDALPFGWLACYDGPVFINEFESTGH